MKRAATLAESARAMAILSDQLVRAVRQPAPDLDRIEHILGQARRQLPPHPFTADTVLAVVLAAQVDPGTPLEDRLGWLTGRADEPRLRAV